MSQTELPEPLSERLQVRTTPSFMQALRGEARRLRLRPADLARVALGMGLGNTQVLEQALQAVRPLVSEGVSGGGGRGEEDGRG